MISVSPFSRNCAGNIQFAGKIPQKKIDKYNTGLDIPDSIHISPENTVKRESASLMRIMRNNLMATTMGVGGLLYTHSRFEKADKEEQALEDKIRHSPVPVTGMKAIAFPLPEEHAITYLNDKNKGALERFPFILNFRSPSSRQKVIAYITNDPGVADLLAEKAKNPFGDDADRVDFSDDEEEVMQPILPTKGAHKITSVESPSADRSVSSLKEDDSSFSDDGQPENSPFHNAADRKNAPPRPTVPKPVFSPTRTAVKLIQPPSPSLQDDDQTPFDVWSGV